MVNRQQTATWDGFPAQVCVASPEAGRVVARRPDPRVTAAPAGSLAACGAALRVRARGRSGQRRAPGASPLMLTDCHCPQIAVLSPSLHRDTEIPGVGVPFSVYQRGNQGSEKSGNLSHTPGETEPRLEPGGPPGPWAQPPRVSGSLSFRRPHAAVFKASHRGTNQAHRDSRHPGFNCETLSSDRKRIQAFKS